MAQVILGGVGQAIGGPLGRTLGSVLGRSLDQSLLAGLAPPRQQGPRLESLSVQGTAEGAPTPCVFGRARVTGQVIWAARFLESRQTASGGKGGPRTVDYGYSLSFAVALGEGPIDGIGRVWADGRPMDLAGVTLRVHRGGEDQTPDPLIEAVEGGAPAYRGTAYVVFEDLPLGPYGDRPPQLAFEVFRRPTGAAPRLEDRLEGVCLIPGAGEFVLATEPVMRREGLTRTTPENLIAGDGRTDLVVSLDQLQAHCPNLKRVSLVIGWFGDDLRAGQCTVRPGVERLDKPTEPIGWSVAGLTRSEAHLISRTPSTTPDDGGGPPPPEGGGEGPAYGGTPSDDSVRQAVAELKARGLEVVLYPFVFMDIPAGNGRADPYGGAEQAPYPWRGRVRGRDGEEAHADVTAMFGAADGWGLRRLALHYAALAVEAGADGLLIGSEMRGLTLTTDGAGGYPAVEALRALAADCRAVVGPDVTLGYAADWSEYAGPRDGGDVVFHLDPLWADPVLDHVGIDWYAPLGDWRDGDGGVDAAAFAGPDDEAYLAAQVAGGEGFDWFYASDADRAAQTRTPIADTAHGEDWIYRVKDLKGWWSSAHHERIGGVRSATPTGWVPGMKPVRLTEFGCPAVDRGGNAPNLFQDPKSAENALPPFSTGARDDRMQRRVLTAVLAHYAEPANNPVSAVYGGPMLAAMDAWCWDARPFPAFPARSAIWADASAWRTGHWLNGRLGGETRDLIAAVLRRGGLSDDEFTVEPVAGAVDGYVIDRPMRTRDALEPLLGGLGLVAAERDGRVAILGPAPAEAALTAEAMASPDDGPSVRADRRLEATPGAARVRFIDANADYRTGSVVVRGAGEGGGVDLDLPAVCSVATARRAAERALDAGGGERLTVALGPLEALKLEPGDGVSVEGRDGVWRVMRLEQDETPSAVLEPMTDAAVGEDDGRPALEQTAGLVGAPFFRLVELPPLIGAEDDARPLAVVAAEPWRPMRLFAGASPDALTARGDVMRPSTVGTLMEAAGRGPAGRWDGATALMVRIEGVAPQSRTAGAVLAGANGMAVETADGWELIQFRTATLVEQGVWRLEGLLRGQQGTAIADLAAGAVVVLLDEAPARAETPPGERGAPLLWRAGPVGAAAGGPGVSEIGVTLTGVHDRPWSPCHLRTEVQTNGDRVLDWIARSRIDGDRWDGQGGPDAERFRVRLLDGTNVRRVFEVEGSGAVYPAGDVAEDFPGGVGPDAVVAVAQWGERYGWGVEARRTLA